MGSMGSDTESRMGADHQAGAGFAHIPVLMAAVVAQLSPAVSGYDGVARLIDGTLGGGGHAAALMSSAGAEAQLLGIDTDRAALAAAGARLAEYGQRVVLAHGNFREIGTIAAAHGFSDVQSILLDLGVSSYQIDTAARGFSFQAEGPLDMRLNPDEGPTAADLVNELPEVSLADIIYRYGEEHGSRRVARFIVEARRRGRISSTEQLAEIVAKALGGRHGRIHPATRTFQALRIAVNRELESLEQALPQAVSLLAAGGRIGVISFHSLEDRIVKQFFRAAAQQGLLDILTKKPIEAEEHEARTNPRSRSAKLRVAARTTEPLASTVSDRSDEWR